MHPLPRELEPAIPSTDPLAEFKQRVDGSLDGINRLADAHFAESEAHLAEVQGLAEIVGIGRIERQADKLATAAANQLSEHESDLARRIERIEAEAEGVEDPELDSLWVALEAKINAVEQEVAAAVSAQRTCHGRHRRAPQSSTVRVRRTARRSTSRGDPDDDEPAKGRHHNLDLAAVAG